MTSLTLQFIGSLIGRAKGTDREREPRRHAQRPDVQHVAQVDGHGRHVDLREQRVRRGADAGRLSANETLDLRSFTNS
jgi:hypothetical protein